MRKRGREPSEALSNFEGTVVVTLAVARKANDAAAQSLQNQDTDTQNKQPSATAGSLFGRSAQHLPAKPTASKSSSGIVF